MLSLLRPGKRPSGKEATRILRHVIGRIRRNWPRVEITVRGDGHYGTPEVMEGRSLTRVSAVEQFPAVAELSQIVAKGIGDEKQDALVTLILDSRKR